MKKHDQQDLINEIELDLVQPRLKEERQISDNKYAIKLVELIVFAGVGLALVAIAGAIIRLILIQ